MSVPGSARALLLSAHPIPTVAVTALGTGTAVLAELRPLRVLLVGAAILAGQLSIGWSNDYLDAERDRAVARTDKPVATGAVSARITLGAAIVALLLAVGFSVWLGWPGGAAALVIVVCGWLYNIGLKATLFSFVPYAIAFGSLPAVSTTSAAPWRWPSAWAVAAGALLGVAAHLANVLPDLVSDAATGVRGLPHRLGGRVTALAVAVILGAASAVIQFGPDGSTGWPHLGVFVVAAALTAIGGATAFRNPASRQFFFTTIVVAALDLVSFALTGSRL